MRLITVVMKEETSEKRSSDTTKMLDYGFNTYEMKKILTKDTVIGNISVSLGTSKNVDIVPMEDVNILNNKTSSRGNITYNIITNNVSSPIKVGDDVGDIIILEDGKEIKRVDITVKENIDKVNIFISYLRNVVATISGKLF